MTRKIGVRLNLPYLQGAYLALNAVRDVHFLGDGPSCIFSKAEQIHGRHDLFSTLLSCDSRHRVQHTGLNVFNMVTNTEGMIADALRKMAADPGCKALFMGSMPMCAIAGTDYERITREALAGSGKPSFVLPRRSAVSGDWLDGYASVLQVLACGIDLSGAKPEKDAVAVVGYFMDRNEGEHWGNLGELKRMLGALDLTTAAIWLSGSNYEDLRRVRSASAIISLPHARKAGRILADRLKVRLVEAELPFGLPAARRFMERLGTEFGREDKARDFIARELRVAAPRLQWSVPHAFLNRSFVYGGDPYYAPGFSEQICELGGRMMATVTVGERGHLSQEKSSELAARGPLMCEPQPAEVREAWGDAWPDLFVGNAFVFQELGRGQKWMEFGYPSECTHFLKDEPFLGFSGALGFLTRLANEVVRGLHTTPLGARGTRG